MKLSTFITTHLDEIVAEWEAFARTLTPSQAMSAAALRDHSREMLLAVAKDMETGETEEERAAKSKGRMDTTGIRKTAAALHGELRQTVGFDLVQLVSEFRAMRASVLALWAHSARGLTAEVAVEEVTRFNEGIDMALAESVGRYSADVSHSRDLFLAVLGHDLRGPLSGIHMASISLAIPEMTPAARQKTSERIQRASKEMNRLITDLLEYTRCRLGPGIPIERAPCDLGPVCEEAIEAIRTSHPDRPFVLELSGDLHIKADTPRMQQALQNLLHNAVQHGRAQTAVSLCVRSEEKTLELKVTNQGQPIPSDALESIFEPLVQASGSSQDSSERSKTSLGLGLFIVREVVLGHEGTIEVQSSAEAGTCFTIHLPRTSRQ